MAHDKLDNFKGKRGINGLAENPQNINKKGRPVSIRNEIKTLLEKDGSTRIPANQVINVNEDGSVDIKIPTKVMVAMRLLGWVGNRNGHHSLKAIQMAMEQIDGKPLQEVEIKQEQPFFPEN